VIIYRAKMPDASYRESLVISDARTVTKNGNILYVTGTRGLKRINLEKEPAIVETLLPENRIEGDTRPYSVFDLQDSTGKRVGRAFLDAGQNLYTITAAVNGSLIGEDCGDFVLFSLWFNSGRYYHFSKKTGEFKQLFVPGEGLIESGVLSNVLKMDDRYYVVRSHGRNINNETKNFISVYELVNGELRQVFTEQAQLFTHYNEAPPVAAVFVPIFYSNFIVKDGRIYFWAKSSYPHIPGFDFKLNAIDIGQKELKSWSLNNAELSNRMNRQSGRVSFYLSNGPRGVYTHNLNDDQTNFEYEEATGSFREVNIYAPRDLHFVSTHLLLNFTYPNRVIAYDIENAKREVLKLETPDKNSPVSRIEYGTSDIFFVNDRDREVHVFNGEEVKSNKLLFEDDFRQVKFWDLTRWSHSNFMLLGVHGVRKDAVEGGHLYAVDKSTFGLTKISTFEADFNTSPYQVSVSAGPMSLIAVNQTTYLYTDYSPQNTRTVTYKALGEGVSLVHSFNSESAVLNNARETFYYNFKTGVKTHLTSAVWNTYSFGNRVFYVYVKDLYFVNPEGTRTRIASLGNEFSGLVEDAGDFLAYRKTNGVGFLDKFSAKYTEFKTAEGSVFETKYLVANGTPYLFTRTGIIKLDVEKGRSEITAANIKEIQNPSVFGNKIFFHEAFASDYEKSRIWCFEEGKLRVLINELNIKGNGHQVLNQPIVFRNASTGNHAFWIPEKEKLFFFEGHDFSDNEYIGYKGFAGENHYFYSFNNRHKQWEMFLFSPATEEFKSVLLTGFDPGRNYLFGDKIFYTSDKEIRQLAGTEEEVITDLRPVRVAGTGLFGFKNNVYVWAKDENGIPQVFRLTDNESQEGNDVLLTAENPGLSFSFYPNPTEDYLTIRSTAYNPAKYKITIISTEGKVLSEQNLDLPGKINLGGLKTGVYLINVRWGNDSKTFRAVKQ